MIAGLDGPGAALLAGTIVLESPLWLAARGASRGTAAGVLAALVAVLVLRMATVDLWNPVGPPGIERWAHSLPGALGGDPERPAYVGGALTFLLTAGNTYVRLLLAASPGLAPTDPKVPGGGRVIGSLERALVFGLAVAGELGAAAVVVSLKGILRFAEVRSAPTADVDPVTEYVLVGSLASIALALAFAPFAVA